MNKKLILVFFLATLSGSNNIWADDKYQAKIAIVDVRAVQENSIAIGDIKKSMSILGEKISRDINQKETELKKSENELLKKKTHLSETDFEAAADIFNKQVSEAQKQIQDSKNKLEHIHNEAIGKVNKVTMDIIGRIVKDYEIELVLPSSQVVFAAERLNITPEVIAELNKKLKNVKINTK